MALSDDQRAMLRLLAQREQGYEDLAALMGLSVDEVRVKVKEALEQLDEGETAPPLPPEPAPAAEPAQVEEPEAVAEPAAPEAPAEEKPSPPAPEVPKVAAARPSAPRTKRSSSSPPRLSMPSGQGARAAIAAGVAVVVLVIVVLIVSGGGSGSDTTTSAASNSTAAETTPEAQTTPTSNNSSVTQAVLSSVDGSAAKGTAVFGRVKNSLALQIEAEGLEPTKKGQSYWIWLAQSPQKMLPLASTAVPKSGKIAVQYKVPTEVLSYLANETFGEIAVTLAPNSLLKASLAKATKEKKAPTYTGTAVLLGPVTGPIVGAAKKTKK